MCVCVCVYGDLQRCLSNIPKNDVIIVLGDFNARVGVGTGSADDVWQDVRGRFGVGNCNAAGERLLMWCATNQLSIMNTWFQKPDFRRGTWKHPATKQYHMIDFVLMHRHQRARCHDVAVVRVANCFTDHFMVRARIAFGVTQRRSMRSCNKPCKIAVERLSDPRTCKTFQKDIEDGLFTKCESTATAEGKSNTICDCLQETSDQVLGPWGRVQSDWFLQALPGIQAILDEKNKCHMAMVQKDIRVSRSRFRASQKRVAKTVRQAKEQWIGRLSKAADDSDRDSKWPCIKKLQLLHSGRKPVRIPTIVDEQGNLLSQPDDIRGRWLRHFSDVLNVESKFEPSVLNMVPEQAQHSDLDVPPTMVELLQAMKCLTAGKAAGESAILPEMVINGGRALHLHPKLDDADEAGVVAAWRDALLVPIPKKSNLHICDNWRGISLLDVIGKLFARILQDRLQCAAEGLLPESQLGFRRGRGCMDMVFVTRQLIEKSFEHACSLYALFVDLRKAYDSIPRLALWLLLERVGVPPVMLNIIKSLHEGMWVKIRSDGGTSEAFPVTMACARDAPWLQFCSISTSLL